MKLRLAASEAGEALCALTLSLSDSTVGGVVLVVSGHGE